MGMKYRRVTRRVQTPCVECGNPNCWVTPGWKDIDSWEVVFDEPDDNDLVKASTEDDGALTEDDGALTEERITMEAVEVEVIGGENRIEYREKVETVEVKPAPPPEPKLMGPGQFFDPSKARDVAMAYRSRFR